MASYFSEQWALRSAILGLFFVAMDPETLFLADTNLATRTGGST
jgi:hypothetical protein